jgi:hypothetical protein
MPNFTTEFKVFVCVAILLAVLGALFFNQFALSESLTQINTRVEVLELQATVTTTPVPTASPSATSAPTKLPLKFVSPSPVKGVE